MKAKRILSCISLCCLMLFTSCDKTVDTKDMSPTEQYVAEEFSKRNITPGMSEEEVLTIEKDLTFTMDSSRSSVTSDGSIKSIYSNELVDFEGQQATVKYRFINDSLDSMEYVITLEYPSSEILSQPAYSLYLELSFKYTELLGNPASSNSDTTDNSFFSSYSNLWGSEESSYYLSIFGFQSKYRSFTDEYNDTVIISFVAMEI